MDSLSGTTSPCSVTKLFQKPCITYRSPINEPHSSLSHSPAPSNQQLQFQYPSHHTYIYTTPTPQPPPPPPQLYTPPTLPTSFPCLSPSKQIFSSGIEFGHTYIHIYIPHLLTYLLTLLTNLPPRHSQIPTPIPNPKSQIPNPKPNQIDRWIKKYRC